MPEVARYDRRRVATSALPGVRKTAAETAESQGAGLAIAKGEAGAALAEGIGQTAGLVSRIGMKTYAALQEQERQASNETALLAASNKLADWKNSRLLDPTTGAFAKKGEAALGLPEQLQADYDKSASEIEAGLSTPEQKAAFARMRSQEWQNVDLQVRRHVFGEVQAYRLQELDKAVANGVDEAIRSFADPRLVGQNLAVVVSNIRKNAAGLGMGAEAVDAQIRTVTSSVHTGVISQLLSNDRTSEASTYFEATKGEIAADKLDEVTRALEEGSVRKTAQQAFDQIRSEGGSLSEQLKKVRERFEGKERDEIESRLEHAAAVDERNEREADRQRLRGVYDILDQGKPTTAIPPAVWATMDGSERSAARSYARQLAEGVPVKTDDATFYGLMRQAMSDPQAFAAENLMKHKARLSSGDFQQLAGLQLSITNGERNQAVKDLEGFRTKNEILENSLAQYGIETRPSEQSTGEKAAIAQLQRMLDRRLEALGPGAKVSNSEIQEAIDGILGQSVTVPGSWWNIFPGGKPFLDQQKRIVDMSIDDVPRDVRTRIEQGLRRRNRPITDATILDTFIEMQVK